MHTEPCKFCPAKILFVKSAATQNWLCLDPEPVANGNTVIVDNLGHVLSGSMFEPSFEGLPRYISHWANCPGRAKAREHFDKKKGKK